MKVGEAKEENEGMKDCRTQAVAVHSDVTKISRARFYFRVEGRKLLLICPKPLQPVLERHEGVTAKRQVSCYSHAELRNTNLYLQAPETDHSE